MVNDGWVGRPKPVATRILHLAKRGVRLSFDYVDGNLDMCASISEDSRRTVYHQCTDNQVVKLREPDHAIHQFLDKCDDMFRLQAWEGDDV